MPVTAVFFDVGETLVDETGAWGRWADWLGLPRLTFFAAIGAILARGPRPGRPGEDRPLLREVIELLRPNVDVPGILARRQEAGFTIEELYPDALPCLAALQRQGYRIGIAANQPALADGVLRRSGLPFEWLLISELEGVSKPDPRFFERIEQVSGLPASSIAYVGDRVDNDVIPAAAAGMCAVHVRRGPWGVLQADWPEAERAALRIESLEELPGLIDRLR